MSKNKGESFSLRQVIELTGISEFTLRGWENRYQAFHPKRTQTGRRLYSLDDIEKLRLLQELLNQEHKIGEIATLSLSELKKIPLQTALAGSSPLKVGSSSATPKPSFSDTLEKIFSLTTLFQWDEIRDQLSELRNTQEGLLFLKSTLPTLIAKMNSLVDAGQFSIAQEHIFSALVKEQIFLVRSHRNRVPKSKARFVITSPEGDMHDMGLAIASTINYQKRIHTLPLGPNTPKKDLCETCLRYQSSHLLLTSTISEKEGAKESLFAYIQFIDKNLPKKIVLILAGRNTSGLLPNLERPMKVLSSFDDYIKYLSTVK